MATTHTDPELSRLAHCLLWPGFTGTTAPDWLLRALDAGLGGVVFFASNIDANDPGQVVRLAAQIHDANPEALIGVDEEGGLVTRLEAATGSSVPGNAVLGRLDDTTVTERTARWIGRLVASAGIDVDLAPDVDVNVNPRNPVIGVRAFSADPDVVSRHTSAFVRGIQAAGVAACAKHFPGHGDTVTDSHRALAVFDIGIDELTSTHLAPFRAAIDAGVKAIMSAHIRIPELGEAPATLNPRSLALARDLGFTGVIVTDALDMAAIRETVGTGPGAVAALAAGADLLCVGNPGEPRQSAARQTDERDFREPVDAVYDALANGELSIGRAEEAAARNADLVAWCAAQATPVDPGSFDGVDLAARALESVGDVRVRGHLLLVDARLRPSRAVGDVPEVFARALAAEGPVTRVGFGGRDPADAAARTREALGAHAGDVVVLVDQPQVDAAEQAALETVLGVRPDAIVLQVGWPQPRTSVPSRALFTFGSSPASASAAAHLLHAP